MNKPDGGPAFPIPASKYEDHITEYSVPEQSGMSLRDWFAGQALAGMLANGNLKPEIYFAGTAYRIADEMIAERERQP